MKENQKNKSTTSKYQRPPAIFGNIFHVEKILARRKRFGKIQYLIKWYGYPLKQSTWEQKQTLNLIDQYLEQFDQKQNQDEKKIEKKKKVKKKVKQKKSRIKKYSSSELQANINQFKQGHQQQNKNILVNLNLTYKKAQQLNNQKNQNNQKQISKNISLQNQTQNDPKHNHDQTKINLVQVQQNNKLQTNKQQQSNNTKSSNNKEILKIIDLHYISDIGHKYQVQYQQKGQIITQLEQLNFIKKNYPQKVMQFYQKKYNIL